MFGVFLCLHARCPSNVERLSDVLGSDALNNLITTAIDIKENTAIVNFSELFTGSKNVIKLTKDNAPVGTKKLQK
jgi:hypothetical protein